MPCASTLAQSHNSAILSGTDVLSGCLTLTQEPLGQPRVSLDCVEEPRPSRNFWRPYLTAHGSSVPRIIRKSMPPPITPDCTSALPSLCFYLFRLDSGPTAADPQDFSASCSSSPDTARLVA